MLEIIEKDHIPILCLSVTGSVFYLIRYGGSNFTAPDCLQSVITNLYLWVVILAIIGCGRKYFNWETDFTQYMTKSSYGIYILHYPILIIICYTLHYYTGFPAIWKYVIALVVELIMTLTVNEFIKRVPVLRYFVLGIKKHKK